MVCDGLSDVLRPCGWRLCKDLCDSMPSCSSPDYTKDTLTCDLKEGSPGDDQGDGQGVGQANGQGRECRNIQSRRGVSVTVCTKDPVCRRDRGKVATPSTKNTNDVDGLKDRLQGQPKANFCGMDSVMLRDPVPPVRPGAFDDNLEGRIGNGFQGGMEGDYEGRMLGDYQGGMLGGNQGGMLGGNQGGMLGGNQGGMPGRMKLPMGPGCPVILRNTVTGIYIGNEQIVFLDNNNVMRENRINVADLITFEPGNVVLYDVQTTASLAMHAASYRYLYDFEHHVDFTVYCLTGMKYKQAKAKGFKIMN